MVVIRDGFSLTEVEVISFAREGIAKYKAPHSVEFRPSLPRNNTGKVMKRDLRMPYWAGRERLV